LPGMKLRRRSVPADGSNPLWAAQRLRDSGLNPGIP
jgi:hypothetical protein